MTVSTILPPTPESAKAFFILTEVCLEARRRTRALMDRLYPQIVAGHPWYDELARAWLVSSERAAYNQLRVEADKAIFRRTYERVYRRALAKVPPDLVPDVERRNAGFAAAMKWEPEYAG